MLDSLTTQSSLSRLDAEIEKLRPIVEEHITVERMTRYLRAIAETPAPSTAASIMRGPVLHELLEADNALDHRLALDPNYSNTGSTVILTGNGSEAKPLWYFAHLDTISYLVGPANHERLPLIPFCYHLTENGERDALCYRFDLGSGRYVAVAEGVLESEAGAAYFRPTDSSFKVESGDRIVPVAAVSSDSNGDWTGHFDNAGGVAALAVAAPVLARAGLDAMLAFPDEEEGPHGSGNQVIGRGGSRIIDRLAPPDLAVVVDMQQSGESSEAGDTTRNGIRLGKGAVLSEFSSLGRGAVTPPHLLALARHATRLLGEHGVGIQESQGNYTSRSDDVSVMLKTPNILLLGFPGLNRHFDAGLPKANLGDIVNLSKALVHMALLRPIIRTIADQRGGVR
jgi:putative aminopeptidase FrvX